MKTLSFLLVVFILAGSPRAERVTPVLKIGEISPSFMLPSLDDKRVSLRDYCGALRQSWKNGKRHIVIVSFMASYCMPCRREIPILEAYAATKEDDVKILYISVDTIAAEQLLPFVQQMKILQPVLQDRYGSTMKKYGVQKLPSLFILDKEGAVRFQNLDGLPENVDLLDLLKSEVAKIRKASPETSPAVASEAPSVAPLTSHAKLEALSGLLAGKSADEILKSTGISGAELDTIRRETESVMRAKWGFKD